MRAAVSVIVIFLNAEKYLRDAVESVFAQTFSEWELFLVDDGSTDASTAYACRYAEGHPARVRYLEHRGHANRGMSASRNLGIRAARSQYVAFLDADDVWRPEKLARQVAILEADPAAVMVQGAPLYWHSWTGNPQDASRDHVAALPAPGGSLVQPPRLLASALTAAAPPPWPSDVLVRREAIEAVGGFEEAFRGMYEDQAFFAKLQLRSPVFVSDESWLKYRQHDESCYVVSKRTGQRHAARLFYLTWLKEYLAGQEGVDPRITRLLDAQLRPYRPSARIRLAIRRLGQRVKTSCERLMRSGQLLRARTW